MYQLEDLNQAKKEAQKGSSASEKYEADKHNFIKKMNEMSKLLMNEEG